LAIKHKEHNNPNDIHPVSLGERSLKGRIIKKANHMPKSVVLRMLLGKTTSAQSWRRRSGRLMPKRIVEMMIFIHFIPLFSLLYIKQAKYSS
jgi:hypothetical protein